MTISIPQDVGSKRGRKKKVAPVAQLYFKTKRCYHLELDEQFHVVYMKMAKHDTNQELKNLLIQYQ